MKRFLLVITVLSSLIAVQPSLAQDDVADVPSQDLRAGKNENKRYFLVGPLKEAKVPPKGFGLLIVMPGGAGNAEFHPFVKRIFKNAVPDGFVLAQPVAFKWTDNQTIVWPTAKTSVEGMKFSTEEFVDAVIKDVGDRQKIDPERIYTLTWSSSGPAAYAISLTNPKVKGSFIAMSVFKPTQLPALEKGKGHAYFVYHSPDDRVCPFRMAQQAAAQLEMAGARVKLSTYEGGHGWRGPLYDNIREGMEWLEQNRSRKD